MNFGTEVELLEICPEDQVGNDEGTTHLYF